MKFGSSLALAMAAASLPVLAFKLDATNTKDVTAVALQAAQNVMNWPHKSGRFEVQPLWYWWIGGAAWDTVLSYGAFSNDRQFQDPVLTIISNNAGPTFDFVLPSLSGVEAQDDQMFWTMAALTGLELGIPHDKIACPADKHDCHPFLDLAINGFKDYTSRWQTGSKTCDGGLTWGFQEIASNPGQMTYKNSVTNGAFFQVCARLARYTGDKQYADWANKAWDWMAARGLLTEDLSVHDGVDSNSGCKNIVQDEWSYNVGLLMYGAAAMADYTNGTDKVWTDRVAGLTDAAIHKFTGPSDTAPGVLYEPLCLSRQQCNSDQQTFKGYLARWMGRTASLCPKVHDRIENVLRASATGAAKACTGGPSGNSCGQAWFEDFSGEPSPSQDLAVFDALVALLGINHRPLKAAGVPEAH